MTDKNRYKLFSNALLFVYPTSPGISLRALIRLLRRCRGTVAPIYLLRLLSTLVIATLLKLLNAADMIAWRRSCRPTLAPPPLFILGHWRSGTTLLHELLATDPTHIALPTISAYLPRCSPIVTRLLARGVAPFLPSTRPFDAMPLNLCGPCEEEQAILNDCGVSVMASGICPSPHGHKYSRAAMTLRGLPRGDRQLWAKSHRAIVEKLCRSAQGARPVLKSPANTARIRFLNALYPGALFLHIRRNPYRVFASTKSMLAQFEASVRLCYGFEGDSGAEILATGVAMYTRYKADSKRLGYRLHEIAYEDLIRDPHAALNGVYTAFGLDGFANAWPHMKALLDERTGHKLTQLPPLSAVEQRLVRQHWAWAFDDWGYPM